MEFDLLQYTDGFDKRGPQSVGLSLRAANSRNGRGERIRTSGLLVPNQALYQAEPRPDENRPQHRDDEAGPYCTSIASTRKL
jgi:hypothetical protein